MRNGWAVLFLLAAAAGAAELPVTTVVLYKHGVGYFERAGTAPAGESVRLEFRREEMDDVLKSLTLETAQGAVAALRYDAAESLEKKLSRFRIELLPQQPISRLLDRLKGERLVMTVGGTRLSGVIVGARVAQAGEGEPEREQVTLLLDSGAIVTRDLAAVTELRFADPALQRELEEYLATVAASRSQERRSLYIDTAGDGPGRIRVRYMIPAPVWKSSYRLIFPAGGRAWLEGWAIVDNTTGEDWRGVRLSLVSGRPISFLSRLYEPKYAKRPVAELPEERAAAPVVHEGAVTEMVQARRKAAPAVRAMKARPGFAAEAMPAPPPAPSTITGAAAGREAGELFEYRFEQPVTIPAGQSAMLPFLQETVDARKLVIYAREDDLHPRYAAELTNTTGKTLDGGPVTVFDGGVYAGEALLETLKAGDKRLISYGIDLGTRITTRFRSDRAVVREVHLRRGVLETRSAVRETKTYTIRNVEAKPKTVLIEHPARAGYELVLPKAAEKTPTAYRFEAQVGPRGSTELTVVEERILRSTTAVTNLTPDVLLSYVENTRLSETARRHLRTILDLKRRIAEADAEIQRIEKAIQDTARDEDRIRKNIQTLSGVSGQQEQVQKYAAELARLEGRIAELRDEAAAARSRKADLEKRLNEAVEAMEF